MFSNKNKNSFPSIISSDVEITGQIRNSGTIQLEGTVNGEVAVESLTIGTNGKVNGDIRADEVIVKGYVEGTIKATKVILEQTASVIGDIFHGTISIQEGASVQGSMTQKTSGQADKSIEKTAEKHNKGKSK